MSSVLVSTVQAHSSDLALLVLYPKEGTEQANGAEAKESEDAGTHPVRGAEGASSGGGNYLHLSASATGTSGQILWHGVVAHGSYISLGGSVRNDL